MAAGIHHWGGRWGAAPVVCATAAWNALGFDPYQTWAFRRAELPAFSETPFRCANGSRLTMARIRTLPPRAAGVERLLPVGKRLLSALAPGLGALPGEARLALVLCLGERFAAQRGPFAAQRRALEAGLLAALDAEGRQPVLAVHPRGHAALAFALAEAGAALASRKLDAAVVGGLDTCYDPEVVTELLEAGRLFDGENLDSFIPGEGGAFALLARGDVASRAGLEELASVESVATALEPTPRGAAEPSAAQGLSRAMVAVAERLAGEGRTVEWWLGDLTHESERAAEWQLAFPRACSLFPGSTPTVEFLPVLLGDLGAATLPTGLALATEAFRRGDPPAGNCVLTAGGPTADRGAVLLARVAEAPTRRP